MRRFTPTAMACVLSVIFPGSLFAASECVFDDFQYFRPINNAEKSGLPTPPEGGVRLTADSIEGVVNQDMRATGRVIAEYEQKTLNSELISYHQSQGQLESPGDFVLQDNASQMQGKAFLYDSQSGYGVAKSAQLVYEMGTSRFQGEAEQLEQYGKDYYRLTDARVNTCQSGDDSWYIRATSVDADPQKNIGVARNARLVFYGVPLLYVPWMDFPLSGNRKSGFLAPEFSFGSDGFDLKLPYYFNLASNYDAVLAPHFYTRRGLAWHGQFRYLQPNYHGQLSGFLLGNDQLTKRKRYAIDWNHAQTLLPRLTMAVDYHQVSDDEFYRDLGGRLDLAENINLNRSLQFSYSGNDWLGGRWSSKLLFQRYQTLQDDAHSYIEPYRRLPHWTTNWNANFNDYLNASMQMQVTRFAHPTRQEGWREVFYPSVGADFSRQWGFFRPKMSIHSTAYQLDDTHHVDKPDKVTRTVPIFSVDTGLFFERDVSLWGNLLTQTLEPRLFYTYIPAREQNNLPNFDSSENDFTYAQLFRENRYSGQDRINAANQITTAISSRFYRNKDGSERFRAGLGQRFYLTDDTVTLSGHVQQRESRYSDLFAFAEGQVTPSVRVQADGHYNPYLAQIEKYTAELHYSPEVGKILNVRYRFDRYSDYWGYASNSPMRYVDVGLQWPISKNVSFLARHNYSFTDKRSLDTMAGLQYQAACACWSASAVFQQYVTDVNERKKSVFFQLRFKGLGGFGKISHEEMRRAIPGYRPLD